MIKLPWTSRTAPHFVLEINRRCNISCEGCYKHLDGSDRSLEDIAGDLRDARMQREIHTVSIAGAEPTLHPQLCEITHHVHEQGLKSALISNGLALDDDYLEALKRAGLDIIMFHIDEGQRRPDMSPEPSWRDISDLRTEMTVRAASHGLDTGLSVTIHPAYLDRVPLLIQFIVDSPQISFLFATSYFSLDGLLQAACNHAGDDGSGLPAHHAIPSQDERTTNRQIAALLREKMGFEPFAYLPASWCDDHDAPAMSWMSYFVPVIHGPNENLHLKMRASLADAFLFRISRLLSGKYMFYFKANPVAVGMQLVLNALATGRVAPCVQFLNRLRGEDARLSCKRLVFDNGPVVTADGQIACGVTCPNATVRHGHLRPVCMADKLQQGGVRDSRAH